MSRQIKRSDLYRIEVKQLLPHRNRAVKDQILQAGFLLAPDTEVNDLYFLKGRLKQHEIQDIATKVITDHFTVKFTAQQVHHSQDRVEVFTR